MFGSYLCSDGEVEELFSLVPIEWFSQNEDRHLGGSSLQTELPLLIALDDGIGDLGVGRVRFVPVQGCDPPKYCESWKRKRKIDFNFVDFCTTIRI